jgi:tetrathionate reductase subunit A
MSSRRNLLKGIAAVGGLAAFATGYAHTAEKAVTGLLTGSSGKPPRKAVTGNAFDPEYRVDPVTGALELNPDQAVSFTMCLGCNTMCGVRVRSEKATGQILRVAGNPYHPFSGDPHIPFETPVRDALLSLTRQGEKGLSGRSTACGRGNAALAQVDNPYRVLKPMKRVGPRGSGQWETISFEQLVEEVVEGGDLFGEGAVEGLRAIYDTETPLDSENPEYGPKANQLAVINATTDGRDSLIQRFALNAFGTRNYANHGAYCGLSMRTGSGATLDDMKSYAHGKPDFSNVEFAIFMGSAPGNAGKPYKRQGRLVARARTEGILNYVIVDPTLTNATSHAAQDRNRWVPITPGTDAALALGMIRWILDNERYDAAFLSAPGSQAAEALGETTHTNASHLVNLKTGKLLRGADLGWEGDLAEAAVVIDAQTGAPMAHTTSAKGELFHEGSVDTAAGSVSVKTGLSLLAEEARRKTVSDYAALCGVEAAVIEALAREFTAHGKRAAIDAHGGTMSSNGFYTAWSILMLNVLIGNWNWKGGMSPSGGAFPSFAPGPRYDLKTFPGMVKPKGVFLSRSRFPYQKTSEFKRRVAAGESPYPTKAPWYPFSPPLLTEYLTSHFDGYPYRLKALVSFMANPIYGHSGLRAAIEEKMKDPAQLPLFVAIDGFINETSALADYIVPDSVMYESWGWATPWSGTVTKCSTARWPVVEPRQDKAASGDRITMELFFIEVSKRLGLPGFGDGVIADAEGGLHPLNRPEDWYLRAGANVAYAGKPVADASDDDIALSGVARIMGELETALKPEEVRKVAALFARGGRMENADKAYDGEHLTRAYTNPLAVYNEDVGSKVNTMTGKRFVGVPTWYPQRFADGTPIREIYPESDWPVQLSAYKSNMQSSYSIGAPRLRQIHPNNPVFIHPDDAAPLGLASGDAVRIVTPSGSMVATALVVDGVVKGAVAIEHGYGHRELGARRHVIDGIAQPDTGGFSAGVNLNDVGLLDPTRGGSATLGDWAVGAAARQALPARLERV